MFSYRPVSKLTRHSGLFRVDGQTLEAGKGIAHTNARAVAVRERRQPCLYPLGPFVGTKREDRDHVGARDHRLAIRGVLDVATE